MKTAIHLQDIIKQGSVIKIDKLDNNAEQIYCSLEFSENDKEYRWYYLYELNETYIIKVIHTAEIFKNPDVLSYGEKEDYYVVQNDIIEGNKNLLKLVVEDVFEGAKGLSI